jgi:hypothetical protein
MKLIQTPEMLHCTMAPASPIVWYVSYAPVWGFYGLTRQKTVQESEIER